MWDVLLLFITGIAIGKFLKPKVKIEKILPYMAYVLIFIIGVEIGNEGILSQLPEILFFSLLIAISVMIGSIIAVKLSRVA
ncbi:MAG: hypothetical protein DSO07_04510 [Thermoproteota archaeon]|jgi:uncharacterized membrane protein YbjE (DUF340 family)|uniref:DUF340 domain-containing protein n=1 Tax=Candidatus Methanodesulfokora washburnensis TaxID=2478471 RepID=A0A429GWA9_9CREN|nr:LysO family transporter [Candidatus Methanodesulfokores washburnensis]RSN78021.1 DUF340 domain-containing protein [Candidatus Methanodesulfokores washburnensis]RZN60397.1 MAG: DUF340 domain-containing protein [Candidatus Methanodesulfokores washburnensis]TDA41465.1 MAG: hypothetical protein DSO07_04510 [Candidatus Korarchaeota archaeon]